MNKDKNIVIIGCGAGGGTAAQFARKTDRKSQVTIFEKDRYPQYTKCGLPYVISGDVKNFAELDVVLNVNNLAELKGIFIITSINNIAITIYFFISYYLLTQVPYFGSIR